jgi:hypothetical protein
MCQALRLSHHPAGEIFMEFMRKGSITATVDAIVVLGRVICLCALGYGAAMARPDFYAQERLSIRQAAETAGDAVRDRANTLSEVERRRA